jgi:hypothetical protein
MGKPFQPQTLYDSLNAFPGGVNAGSSPLGLPPEILAGAVNVTVRGGNATHRGCYHRRLIDYESEAVQTAVEEGYFQGSCYYFGDDQEASLVALISSRLFQFQISDYTVTCREISITGGAAAVVEPQAWLWQSEKWVIVQDGANNPIFFDGTTAAVRSNYAVPAFSVTTTATNFTTDGIPAVGTSDTIDFTSVAGLAVGYIITLEDLGTFQVQSITGSTVKLLNLTGTPVGQDVDVGTAISWYQTLGQQLPPGRMGCYGMGRNWLCLVDGKQFIASDIVRGASGTVANDYRDSVLYATENNYIKGGGNFTVPGSVGNITAMRFAATLDASLGQGPLQVFTHNTVFSCNAPVDRLEWQKITNPILTESLIAYGALGQNSTVLVNGDAMFRSIDGVRSLILARREFQTGWGNTPQSFEVSPVLSTDDPGLLTFGSAIVFDNRMLMTAGSTSDEQGVYFKALVPLNLDPLSSIRGKLPSVWDSVTWSGPMNILQLLVGEVDRIQRAFAFSLNTTPGLKRIELWEIKRSYNPTLSAAQQPLSAIVDNDGERNIPVTWRFDSSSLRFGIPPTDHEYIRLSNGEIWISDLQGLATFQIYYKADQYPCWALWVSGQECQEEDSSESRPGYRPRLGFGSTNGNQCDQGSGRPLNNGFTFQVRTVIQGHCVVMGEFFEAEMIPQPKFAPIMGCTPQCEVTL